MNPELLAFATTARECAMQMMLNAAYIQRELSTLEMPGDIRGKIESLCESLIGNKHDIMTELFELQESATTSGAGSNSSRVHRIIECLADARGVIDGVVRPLQAMAGGNFELFGTFLLVSESAINIRSACGAAEDAADSLRGAWQGHFPSGSR